MGIEDVLLGSRGIELPDPVAQAKQGLSLADLSSQVQNRQYLLKAAERKDRAQQVLGKILPGLQQGGWSEDSLRTALQHPDLQQYPDVIPDVIGAYNAQLKSQLEAGKTRAETLKQDTDAKVAKAKMITNQAYSLYQKPDLNPQDVSGLMNMISTNGLEHLVTGIPFQSWTDVPTARKGLKTIADTFYETEKAIAAQATEKQHGIENVLKREEFEQKKKHEGVTEAQAWQTLNKPEIKETDTGFAAISPFKGTAQTIVGADQKPLAGKAKQLPEAYAKPVGGIINLTGAIDNFIEKLATWSNADLANPSKRAEMQTAYTNMLLQGKEAANLGALTGPDMGLMSAMTVDPVSFTGSLTPNSAIKGQALQLRANMIRNAENLAKLHRQPMPDIPRAAEAPRTGETTGNISTDARPDPASVAPGTRLRNKKTGVMEISDGKSWKLVPK